MYVKIIFRYEELKEIFQEAIAKRLKLPAHSQVCDVVGVDGDDDPLDSFEAIQVEFDVKAVPTSPNAEVLRLEGDRLDREVV